MAFNTNAGQLALPVGSLVLITGATGFIATHLVKETLAAGYKVRGTARSTAKARDDEAYHANPNYHCVVVQDMFDTDALGEAVKGIDGVIHTSSPTDLKPDPEDVIPPLIKHVLDFLEICLRTESVKRFVYTSSSTAATLPVPGRPGHINKNSWNDEAVKIAWTKPYTPEKAYPVYAASKTEAERAIWKFVEERKPKFVVNTVLPDTNFGRCLNGRMGPTGIGIVKLYRDGEVLSYIPSQWMVNVNDTARIHLAALLDDSVANERILAFDEVFTWSSIIDIISEERPQEAERLQELKINDEVRDATTVENAFGGELLKMWFKQQGDGGRGWVGLRQSVRENLEGL